VKRVSETLGVARSNILERARWQTSSRRARACMVAAVRTVLDTQWLSVRGKHKMSKSLGNFVTVQELLQQGIPGEVIRLALLSTHYREPLRLDQ
jgi:cysteinyl-tRNA synthetase